ncbi:MAG: heparan-alpha-glucosaminide N-acetyltransferase domain-containing protein [Candidatus Micrarchaeota archaeon]|nr:heparan-alpha-glucosaminide N-acetyltransferase domain-containing protein [Candidatus Micrarchaeota archaeon]
MRYKWVDVYRGIAVLFMVTLHFFVNIFPVSPIPFLNYEVRGIISIGDMAIALFLFISGVSNYLSISQRKKSESEDDAVKHVILRYARIFVIGLLLDILLIYFTGRVWWVLEAISLAGLFSLFFIPNCFSVKMKVSSIVIIGLCYSYITSIPWVYSLASAFPNGGILGSVSMSGIVLVGYMSGELIMKKKRQSLTLFIKAGIILLLAGFILSRFITYDRLIGNLPFVILSSGFSILLMVAVYWLVEMKGISSIILSDFGQSALLMFALNYPVLALALDMNLENSFSTGEAALITLTLIALLSITARLRRSFTKS